MADDRYVRVAAKGCAAALLMAALAGCAMDSPRATEVEMSTKYDTVDCAQLIAQRNALQAQYPNLPEDRGEKALAWGGFAAVGDAIDQIGHEERVAKGKIEAMSDSIKRRSCAG